jgi:hypothetical protein
MMLSGGLNTSNHCPGRPGAQPSWCPNMWRHAAHCEQMKISAQNAAWRWEQYGKAAGCKQPLPFDPKGVQCV